MPGWTSIHTGRVEEIAMGKMSRDDPCGRPHSRSRFYLRQISIEELAFQNKLFYCLECGKCTASCPMYEMFTDFSYEFSPRGIVEKVLLDFDILNDKAIWYCLTCDVCTEGCPAGVKFRDFIESIRELAIEEGVKELGLFCKRCGNYFLPTHTLEYLKEKLGRKKVSLDWLLLCPRCKKYDFSQKVKELISGSKKISVAK